MECHRPLDLLRLILHKTWSADRKPFHFFSALTIDKLNYGFPAYGQTSYFLRLLDPIQHEGLHVAARAYSYPKASLEADTNILLLSLRRKFSMCHADLRFLMSRPSALHNLSVVVQCWFFHGHLRRNQYNARSDMEAKITSSTQCTASEYIFHCSNLDTFLVGLYSLTASGFSPSLAIVLDFYEQSYRAPQYQTDNGALDIVMSPIKICRRLIRTVKKIMILICVAVIVVILAIVLLSTIGLNVLRLNSFEKNLEWEILSITDAKLIHLEDLTSDKYLHIG
ncbi:hypothetical protein Anas_07376 [Armadillidium nasatum]|uniref:Uncharacterized protein n=1 Tax=Armadillidium nasatum TaxID=96803 RepID=A0A5N5SIW1_9CRUS|nr:hypothetical protein Anas_07376 [Armadillidium nasatum]